MNDRQQRLSEQRELHEAVDGPAKLLKGLEDAQSALHTGLKTASVPSGVSIAMNKKFSRIKRDAKKMYEQSEDLRLALDEWIIDHKEEAG